METQPHKIPRVAIQSVATGLLMMAFFTMMWTGIASGGLSGWYKGFLISFFGVLILLFVAYSAYFLSAAKRFSVLTDEAAIARGKKDGKWFGIIFAAEGLGIFIAANLVINLGYPDLTVPVIALVVGLHFFPLAKVFKRTLDYYIGAWSTVIAICGIIFTLNKTIPADDIAAFVGIGMAIATSCYGIYMIFTGRGFIKRTPVDVQSAVL